MAIRCKVDIIDQLRSAGFTSYKLRQEKLLGESVSTKLRRGGLPSWHELDIICHLLQCQPGDLIEYTEEEESPIEP